MRDLNAFIQIPIHNNYDYSKGLLNFDSKPDIFYAYLNDIIFSFPFEMGKLDPYFLYDLKFSLIRVLSD